PHLLGGAVGAIGAARLLLAPLAELQLAVEGGGVEVEVDGAVVVHEADADLHPVVAIRALALADRVHVPTLLSVHAGSPLAAPFGGAGRSARGVPAPARAGCTEMGVGTVGAAGRSALRPGPGMHTAPESGDASAAGEVRAAGPAQVGRAQWTGVVSLPRSMGPKRSS